MTKAFEIYIKPEDFAAMVQRGWHLWSGFSAEYGWDAGLGMHRVRLEESGKDRLNLPNWWEAEHEQASERMHEKLNRKIAEEVARIKKTRPKPPAPGPQGDTDSPRWPQSFADGIESVFLGWLDGRDGYQDLYAFRLSEGESWRVLVRWGEWTGYTRSKNVREIDNKDADPSLWEAKQRAIAKGLIPSETKADDDDGESPRWTTGFTSDNGITFLGRYDTVGGKYDLYAYRDHTPLCVLFARFGEDRCDFHATTPDQLSGDSHDALQEARTRAEARGLLGKPRWEHDSACCTFLGCFNGHDLYFCDKDEMGGAVLARYGNEGSNYRSAVLFAGIEKNLSIPGLAEAYRRAVARGLIEALTPTE